MYVNNRDQGGNSTDILKLEQSFKVIPLLKFNAILPRNLARVFKDEWNNHCDFEFCSNYVTHSGHRMPYRNGWENKQQLS